MYDILKKALKMSEDDVLLTALTFYHTEDDRDLGDPTSFTLGIRRNGREVATVFGDIYYAYENEMSIDDFMSDMDDCCVDHGIAGYLAMKKIYHQENELCLTCENPENVIYIREIAVDMKCAEFDARALILKHFDSLWYNCTGSLPNVVTMLFSRFEDDIFSHMGEDDMIYSEDGDACYVRTNGLFRW